jgi:hypothetical protein
MNRGSALFNVAASERAGRISTALISFVDLCSAAFMFICFNF